MGFGNQVGCVLTLVALQAGAAWAQGTDSLGDLSVEVYQLDAKEAEELQVSAKDGPDADALLQALRKRAEPPQFQVRVCGLQSDQTLQITRGERVPFSVTTVHSTATQASWQYIETEDRLEAVIFRRESRLELRIGLELERGEVVNDGMPPAVTSSKMSATVEIIPDQAWMVLVGRQTVEQGSDLLIAFVVLEKPE